MAHDLGSIPPPLVPEGMPAGSLQIPRDAHPGFWLRFVAAFVDGAITKFMAWVVIIAAGDALTAAFGAAGHASLRSTCLFLINVAVVWLYFAALESSPTQATLGKMACGFVVCALDGRRISFWRATGRFFGKWISVLILGIGFLVCIWNPRRQCLHDVMAGCMMLKRRLPI